jgi:uncharacterized protein (DUF1778 family)
MTTMQITVRNVDPALKSRIDREARLRAQSINEFMLDAARAKVGMKQAVSPTENPLQRFVGILPDNAINDSAINELDKIDQSMWS